MTGREKEAGDDTDPRSRPPFRPSTLPEPPSPRHGHASGGKDTRLPSEARVRVRPVVRGRDRGS